MKKRSQREKKKVWGREMGQNKDCGAGEEKKEIAASFVA